MTTPAADSRAYLHLVQDYVAEHPAALTQDGFITRDSMKALLRKAPAILLAEMTGKPKIKMAYAEMFHDNIRKKHRINLRFDPTQNDWQSKSRDFFLQDPNRFDVIDAQAVLNGWQDGTVWFEWVTLDEVARIEDEMEKPVVKPKFARRHKGIQREWRPFTARSVRVGRCLYYKSPPIVPEEADRASDEV
ncbi:hypothetical protein EIP91_000290 [Steccherinum ochraceum]|uniref:Uncharacterized protein n=1 Tax=Steccherinum ochraceum TaxID=92696 RepID=A0A4R0RG28_9APHY|nr:hypothetical protein EIP91_000290 [Steccherinum ochraceum]